jgi:hypothetical protein
VNEQAMGVGTAHAITGRRDARTHAPLEVSGERVQLVLEKATSYSDANKQQVSTTVLGQRRTPKIISPFVASAPSIRHTTTPIQVLEGTVTSVDWNLRQMSARLVAKMGGIPEHAADIDLEWVHQQDVELVRPGAVFYLVLYKLEEGGTIGNNEELRFRRLPAWTKPQIERVKKAAGSISDKLKGSTQRLVSDDGSVLNEAHVR